MGGPRSDPASQAADGRLVRRRRLGFAGGTIALVVAAALTVYSALGGMAGIVGRVVVAPQRAPARTTPEPPVPHPPQAPVTVLVLGVHPGADQDYESDSMMVASYDPRSHTADIMSIPRDLWVDVPGFGDNRIDTAYENAGAAGAELAVERYFGVPVEYYAVVNYDSLVNVVNAAGGVTVDVARAIHDTCFPNALENACTVLNIPAGIQHMNGTEALDFALERHDVPGSDLGREADQQALLLALRHALLRPANILRLPAIVRAVAGTVQTNLPFAEIPTLAQAVLRLPKSAIHASVLSYATGAIANYTTSGGAEVLAPNDAVIRREAEQAFAAVRRDIRGPVVQVENGAPTSQPLATYFTSVLRGMGVSTLPARTAAETHHRVSHVYLNAARAHIAPPLAYVLSEMLDCKLETKAFPASAAEVVVVLGASFPRVQP